MEPHEVEILRRSMAMAPLSQPSVHELLEFAARAAAERAELRRIMAELPESWTQVRATLNELRRIVGSENHPAARTGSLRQIDGGLP